MRVSPQEEGFQMSVNLKYPHPLTEVCGVFSKRVLPSGRAAKSNSKSLYCLGWHLLDASDQQLKKEEVCLGKEGMTTVRESKRQEQESGQSHFYQHMKYTDRTAIIGGCKPQRLPPLTYLLQ